MGREQQPVVYTDEDMRAETVVGRSSGPIREYCSEIADTNFRLARQTRFVLYRDNLGGMRFAPFDDKCPMHWQDIPELNLTPEELSHTENKLDDTDSGFNWNIQKGRKSGSASKTIWQKGYKSSACDKLK